MRDQGIKLRGDSDMTDPRQHAAWALMSCKRVQLDSIDGFDLVEDASPVPVPQMMVPHISASLHRRGFRWHEELMAEDFVPNPGPKGNWMIPNGLWLPVEEVRAIEAERAQAAANGDTRGTIAALMPELAKQLDEMTEEEKKAELARRRDLLRNQLDQMARLASALDDAAGESDTKGDSTDG